LVSFYSLWFFLNFFITMIYLTRMQITGRWKIKGNSKLLRDLKIWNLLPIKMLMKNNYFNLCKFTTKKPRQILIFLQINVLHNSCRLIKLKCSFKGEIECHKQVLKIYQLNQRFNITVVFFYLDLKLKITAKSAGLISLCQKCSNINVLKYKTIIL
jgi:hypothetical protein